MARPVKFDESGDSDDLQALFDSIAASGGAPVPAPVAVPSNAGDSDELQALFDSVANQVGKSSAQPPEAAEKAPEGDDEDVFTRLGQLTRQLHNSMRELGYDQALQDAARQIPDARQRLAYIVQMTEQAASRVLNATDIAKPLQDELLTGAESMGQRWERMFANQLSVDEFKALAADTRAFFKAAPAKIGRTNEQLTEIMMAQDFQDLTGQVIRKVVDMVQRLEGQLLQVLIEAIPADRKAEVSAGLMNGPVVSVEGRTDVVTSQSQVDELLDSLGF
ncbi:MAG: protein phosphatase CheZ [Gammaproteobacteria bacterium]|nr:protein phosphatase CheZ [Gammaproteobacteria bacterium]MBU1415416.1 protein phosphatase CheZ [Gammaproteobacteria bacterium]